MKSVKDNFLNEETRRKEKGESSSRVLVHENKKDKKNQKGVGEVKAEILMVLEEDPNLENISMLSLQQGWSHEESVTPQIIP